MTLQLQLFARTLGDWGPVVSPTLIPSSYALLLMGRFGMSTLYGPPGIHVSCSLASDQN